MKNKKLLKIFTALAILTLLSAGCAKVELKKDIPGSPKESYDELPK